MDTVVKLEKLVAGWYEAMPHLPKSGQQWLVKNIWWIALVGAIIGTMSLCMALFGTFFAGLLLSSFGGVIGAAVAAPIIFVALVSSAVAIVTVVLTFMAVSPLKTQQKRGWTLLFITVLMQVAVQALTLVFTFNLFEVVWGLLFTAIGAYFLFEVRSSFVPAKKKQVTAADTSKKTA